MLDSASPESVLQSLQYALKTDVLSPGARKQAQQLVSRLTRGVRIVLLGPPSVGKSQLCDALLKVQGSSHVRSRLFSAVEVPEVGLSHDPNVPQGFDFDIHASSMLGHVQIIDLAPDAEWHDRAIRLMPEADIVIWCTERFDPEEAEVWSKSSEALKDHSILVLTKADLLAASGDLAERITYLQEIAAEEFHSFFPTTTEQLWQNLQKTGEISDGHFSASGVKALADTVSTIAASGQRADQDGAMLFVERHDLKDLPGTHEQAEQQNHSRAQISPQKLHGWEEARTYLSARALDLAELSFDAEADDLSEVLALCSEISEELVEIVSATPAASPDEKHWHNAFEEASDKVVLMAMEGDAKSAADAVCILLQIRRELDYMLSKAA